jgi:hypothetical protein
VDSILHDGMHEFIDALQRQLNEIDNGIAETFFGIKPSPGQFQSQSQSMTNGLA